MLSMKNWSPSGMVGSMKNWNPMVDSGSMKNWNRNPSEPIAFFRILLWLAFVYSEASLYFGSATLVPNQL